jgi:hypothetical protein
MRSIITGAVLLGVLALPTHAASAASDSAGSLDTAEIEKLTGLKGTLDEKEHVFKVSAPRKDLKVISWGVQLTPPMGLTLGRPSSARAFKRWSWATWSWRRARSIR